MVQIIPMERAPTLGQALGAGLGQGIGQGLNYAVQDMMQQKMNSRQNKSLFAALGPQLQQQLGLNKQDLDKFSSIDPNTFMSVLNMKLQQGNLGGIANAKNRSPIYSQIADQQQEQPELPPQSRTLPAGQAPMLAYEDMPAEEDVQQPQQIRQTPSMQSASKAPSFKQLPYEEKERMVSDYWDQQIAQVPISQAEKYIKAKENDLNRLRQDETLAQQTLKTSTSVKLAEKKLQELPKQVSDRLTQFGDIATRADQSLNAIENIDSLLEQGAQMPEIITDINMKLGPDNPLSNFATNLANNPLAKALETARVQQFTGMKDIFGGQIRLTEFKEFVKKLQDVRDPVITNKIKSVILKQFANMEKFPYLGLEKAKEENRNAPSDVILSKGKKYADQMAKKYAKSSKKEMERIISEHKQKNIKPGFKSSNVNDFRSIPEGHKVRSPSGEILVMRNGKLTRE